MKIYTTIELASYMVQPAESIQKLYDFVKPLAILNCEVASYRIKSVFKDYFHKEVGEKYFIVYKDGANFWVDMKDRSTLLTLDEIQNKPVITVTFDKDGNIKFKNRIL